MLLIVRQGNFYATGSEFGSNEFIVERINFIFVVLI
jgi:hypothetical protein